MQLVKKGLMEKKFSKKQKLEIDPKVLFLDSKSDSEKDYKDYFEYNPKFIDHSLEWMKKILDECKLEQCTVKVFGKVWPEPRLTAVYGDKSVCDKTYIYSKSERKLNPFPSVLEELRNLVFEKTGINFDFVLLNYYRDGNDKVSWHCDNEEMMECSNIVSLSFGQKRKFQVKSKINGSKICWQQSLESGSMVWMKPKSQDLYYHQVPKETKIDQPRLNLTFRKFKIQKG